MASAQTMRAPIAPALRRSASAQAALRRWWPLLAIIVATFALRLPTFGDPNLDYDEQLYLVIGDRLLHGHWPYVDLWDRKPIGLFLSYAAIRLIGGEGVIEYQLVAAACVAATAGLIWAMARRLTGTPTAVAVALAYVVGLGPLHGLGGQAAVLYNPLIAGAAWAATRAMRSADRRHIARLAFAAMAASGIAIQFKYTPFVEGGLLGCVFLYRLRETGLDAARLAGVAAAMIAIALLPTIAAIGVYWWAGHLDAFVQANFVSVFRRAPFPEATRRAQSLLVLAVGAPLIAALALVPWRLRDLAPEDRRLLIVVAGWFAAALIAVTMLGGFYDFYFITVLPPLLILIAPALGHGRRGFALLCLVLLWPALIRHPVPGGAARSRARMTELADAIRPHVGGSRCLYVYDGPTSLYLLTNACAPTRYLYPDHLTNPTEAPALGVDPGAEERRLLATRPGAIVTAETPLVPRVNPATQRIVAAALAADYVLVARVPADRIYDVYALRGLVARPLPPVAGRIAAPL